MHLWFWYVLYAVVFACLRQFCFLFGGWGAPLRAQSWDAQSTHSVKGVTVYDADVLLTFSGQVAFERHGQITAEQVAAAISHIYREDGYFLAEARVASDGRAIVVDEGHLQEVIIEGVDARTYAALERLFAPLISVPALPLKRFERAVMLAEDIPNIDLSTEIDFPSSNGARLRVLVEEQAKSAGTATLDNPPRELGEALSLYLAQEFYSTFAVGDLLRLEASGTINWDQDNEESLWGALTYRLPLHSNGLYSELYYGSVNARRDIS
ncbi:hypothetical protein J7400_17545 [Shimia sp. R9_2]|uniref:hypothetical protein n=1 Tax=Shimia sp. R9_2 TaxID=2821112 RepID=UPI001ADB0D51|nr:hypothetical protein [Shimia sp. R9_2]MBO9398480.1 hypothetical protein [Shimia sp. R9_2]